MATWIGSKRLAVVPAITTGPGGGTAIAAQAFRNRVRERIFFDPDPTTGVDRSLRRYIHTVSYGRAVLDAEVMPTVTVNWAMHGNPLQADPGTTMNAAIMAAGGLANFELIMVVFPAGITGVRSWAFMGSAPPRSYVLLDNGIGAWGMELLHMATDFGDLYNPPAGRSPSPGRYDEMDASDATHPSSFTKQAMGWLDANAIVTVTPAAAAQRFVLHSLALLQPAPPGRRTALRIPFAQNSAAPRYFLVEAREALDDYERATAGITSGIPSEGVVVYDVDEGVWPPLWLRTSTALTVGGTFLDSAEGVELTVEARLMGGGLRVRLHPEPVRCGQIREELADLAVEIKDLQTDLRTAAPGERARLAARIKALQKKVARLKAEAGGLGCRP